MTDIAAVGRIDQYEPKEAGLHALFVRPAGRGKWKRLGKLRVREAGRPVSLLPLMGPFLARNIDRAPFEWRVARILTPRDRLKLRTFDRRQARTAARIEASKKHSTPVVREAPLNPLRRAELQRETTELARGSRTARVLGTLAAAAALAASPFRRRRQAR